MLTRKTMFAVVKIGGNQYLVKEGDRIKVSKLSGNENQNLEIGDVLLLWDSKELKVGKPVISGAKVKAKILSKKRGKKIIVFKYKPKTRYRVKHGFRPEYTTIQIEKIVV